MIFKMWSIWHFLYLLSPFVIIAALYFALKNKSDKVKDTAAVILGAISLFIIIIRNVDIFLRSGIDLEVIPLQVATSVALSQGLR